MKVDHTAEDTAGMALDWQCILPVPPFLIREVRFRSNRYDEEMADGVGFEPTVGYEPTAVFKTAALNRSATHPASGSADYRMGARGSSRL